MIDILFTSYFSISWFVYETYEVVYPRRLKIKLTFSFLYNFSVTMKDFK